jgi:uncharacterized protein (TIGR02599 family)
MLYGMCRSRRDFSAPGFTVIEMLAAMAILTVILTVIFGITQQTSNAWRSTNAKIDAFQSARAAFETISQTLGQATLNGYYDYYDVDGNRRTAANAATFTPASYGRYSDLHFKSGKAIVPGQIAHAIFFQTPTGYSEAATSQGMDTLLNACGYFLTYETDPARPAFLDDLPNPPPTRHRYRLMHFLQPSEAMSVYATNTGSGWISDALAADPAPVRQLAENIIALVILPHRAANDSGDALAPLYEYDTRSGASRPQAATQHQLPPLVDIVMVAIDEVSARRLENGAVVPDVGVGGLFSQASNLESDLATLENTLNARRIGYRIFRTTVALRNAKWSS